MRAYLLALLWVAFTRPLLTRAEASGSAEAELSERNYPSIEGRCLSWEYNPPWGLDQRLFRLLRGE